MANTSARNLKRLYWVFIAVALLVVTYQLSVPEVFNTAYRLQEPHQLPPAPELVNPEMRPVCLGRQEPSARKCPCRNSSCSSK